MANRVADVCLVGVGEAGGILAKELGAAGLDVVAFERGNVLGREDYGPRDSIKFTARLALQDFIRHEPNTFRNSPDQRAIVRRSTTSALGGRMLTWTGQSARFTPDVFKVHSNEIAGGIAERAGADLAGYDIRDWPIDYDDLEPYYEKFEWEFGVSGGGTPNPFAAPRKKGFPLPPLRRNCQQRLRCPIRPTTNRRRRSSRTIPCCRPCWRKDTLQLCVKTLCNEGRGKVGSKALNKYEYGALA